MFFASVFCGLLVLVAPGEAQHALIQAEEKVFIDWSAGTVRAKGIAMPASAGNELPMGSPEDTQNTARKLAESNLLVTLDAIRIDADAHVADRVKRNTAFRDGLAALARNVPVTHQAYLSDGTVEVELTMNFVGGFNQYVLPEEIRQVDSVTTVNSAGRQHKNQGDAFTGLIIDATGIGAMPSLVPVVVDEKEEVVYGPEFVSREFAVSRGMIGFSTTLALARDEKRVGNRPLVIRSIRTRRTGGVDLVISSTDAAKLRSSVQHLDFLKQCRVCIVIDQYPEE